MEANDKCRARLNCISHLLSKMPYETMTLPAITLPRRRKLKQRHRPPISKLFVVPNRYP